ncbi:MAG: hypothetical protein AMXMBFR4_07470 [Candidatus Hydrogenedentota bacterium]
MELEPFVFRREGALIAVRGHREEGELLKDVNRFALRPLSPEEFAVFSLDLCHNQVDRHFSRFPDEELDKISAMTPGRPLMERHDLRGSLPRGTFFRSQVHEDGARRTVRPDVYVLRTRDNEDFILNIEGGVYRETSIGFSFETPECSICAKDLRTCDHVPGRTYGDAQCHYIMRNVLEVIEGSVVPSGSQGTGFVSQHRDGLFACEERVGNLRVDAALEHGRRRFHTPIEIRPRRFWAAE